MSSYNFRPTARPKAGNPKRRLVKRESVFQVERGAISTNRRDTKQLDEYRNRSYLQRSTNTFKTATQRSDLTLGEQDIVRHLPASPESSGVEDRAKVYSVQTFPSVEKAKSLLPGCYTYVQNYHHYVLDIKRLEKGKPVPYLSLVEKYDTNNSTRNQTAVKSKCRRSKDHGTPTSGPSYFAGLPKKVTPKSASPSPSRRGSAAGVNGVSGMALKREEGHWASSVQTPRESECSTGTDNKKALHDLVISEIEDELDGEMRPNKVKSPSDLPILQTDSMFKVPNQSTADMRAPLGTPADTPRSSVVQYSFPSLPSSLFGESAQSSTFPSVTPEIHKPYLAPFTTRIPPLKAPEPSQSVGRRNQNDNIPDYQRYRILCDAFRPNTPHGERVRRHGQRFNFVTSDELDYYIDVVNSINAYPGIV